MQRVTKWVQVNGGTSPGKHVCLHSRRINRSLHSICDLQDGKGQSRAKPPANKRKETKPSGQGGGIGVGKATAKPSEEFTIHTGYPVPQANRALVLGAPVPYPTPMRATLDLPSYMNKSRSMFTRVIQSAQEQRQIPLKDKHVSLYGRLEWLLLIFTLGIF